MIETTLIGSIIGGLFRLAPETLKWLDRKNERAHELAMLDKQIACDKLKADQAIAQINAQAEASLGEAEISAMIEAVKAQATQTGVKWVDAFSALIRPLLAFQWLILLWPAVIVAGFVMALLGGADPVDAMHAVFGVDEKAMTASIASFWLVDRSLRLRK